MLSKRVLAGGLAAALSAGAALAGERPVVVELFTSQGCSSCPPANAYLNELAEGRSDVLPLGFHVTYWDRLGWKDPFSLRAATARQARYGRRFGDGSYTPEIVVDGAVGLVGSDRAAVGGAIGQAKAQGRTAAEVDVTRDDARLHIAVGPGSGAAQVLLVGFDHRQVTPIARGENGGHTFDEFERGPLGRGRRAVVGFQPADRRRPARRAGRGGAARSAGRPDRRRGTTGGTGTDVTGADNRDRDAQVATDPACTASQFAPARALLHRIHSKNSALIELGFFIHARAARRNVRRP